MGAGDGPSIRGVKPDPDAFIDAGGGLIAEREAALSAAVAEQLRMGTPIPSGEVLHQLADQEAAIAAQLKTFAAGAGDGAMRAGAMQGAMQRRDAGRDAGRDAAARCRAPASLSALVRWRRRGFPTSRRRGGGDAAAARAAAQGRNGRQTSDGSCADARRQSVGRGAGTRATRAGGGSGSGSGNNSGGGGDSELIGKGQQQQSRGARLDHPHASPLAAPIAEKPVEDSTVLGFLASPILEGEVVDGWRTGATRAISMTGPPP